MSLVKALWKKSFKLLMDRRSEARLCVHTPPLHHWESEETAGTERASALITGLFEKLSAGSLLLCDALSSKCFHRQPTPSYTHTHTSRTSHTHANTPIFLNTLRGHNLSTHSFMCWCCQDSSLRCQGHHGNSKCVYLYNWQLRVFYIQDRLRFDQGCICCNNTSWMF